MGPRMDDNPYEAPRTDSGSRQEWASNRGRPVWLALLCIVLGPLWSVLAIAMVLSSMEPSTARMWFMVLGQLPAVFLFWIAFQLGRPLF